MRDVYQQMHENREVAFRRLDELQSYIDSRIDKTINTQDDMSWCISSIKNINVISMV